MIALSVMHAIAESVSSDLVCHPRTPSRSIRRIEVDAGETPRGDLVLTYRFTGDLSRLLIPETHSSRPAEDLYRHTCCELFVMQGDGPAYHEFNFSPSQEWAVYAFRGYRDGGPLPIEFDPDITLRKSGDRMVLTAEIGRDILPQAYPLRLGLSVVVEETDGRLSYWALQHPPGKPDFHHRDAFALQLGAVLNA